jgi:transcriptional regulator with XRE-family HTH domain
LREADAFAELLCAETLVNNSCNTNIAFVPVGLYCGGMSDSTYDFDIEPTLASAVRAGRAWTGQTMRRLAATSGVSAAQISRIESGQIQRPAVETLLALAPALNHHPTPVLVLGGQLAGDAAKRQLDNLLEQMLGDTDDDAEREGLQTMRANLPDADEEALRTTAIEALTYTTKSVLWPDVLARAVPATLPDHDVFARVVEAWLDLTPDRRWRLAEVASDMRAASHGDRPDAPPPRSEIS